jgi:hypothetical protein
MKLVINQRLNTDKTASKLSISHGMKTIPKKLYSDEIRNDGFSDQIH